MSDLLPLIAGGAGFMIGKSLGAQEQVPPAVVVQDPELVQRIALLEATKNNLELINKLSEDKSAINLAAIDQLKQQTALLQTQLDNAKNENLGDVAYAFGTADPIKAGWVQGRDGLLVHRRLKNVTPTGFSLRTGVISNSGAGTNELTVANIFQSVTARPLTIGKNVNNALYISFPPGLVNNAVLLTFNEDISVDDGFMCWGYRLATFMIPVVMVPVGRKSVLLVPTFVGKGAPTGWTWSHVAGAQMADSHNEDANPFANRLSSNAACAKMTLSFSHESAVTLSLRSYNVVANPLLVSPWKYQDVTPEDANWQLARKRGALAVLNELNTSVNPAFVTVTGDTKLITPVTVSPSTYL